MNLVLEGELGDLSPMTIRRAGGRAGKADGRKIGR